jgi:hypothetical protein
MANPALRPADALLGLRLGVSVSDSADLGALGLLPRHAELALAEIARSVLTGRGGLVYGGQVKPAGFTQFLMHEVERYGSHIDALTLCLAEPEHRQLSCEELRALDQSLGPRGQVVRLDPDGVEIGPSTMAQGAEPAVGLNGHRDEHSYSAMRRHITSISHARVLIGGQLSDFKGAMPGIIEEAIYAVEAGQPLYVVAGFGGAAALVAEALDIDDLSWAADSFPKRPAHHRIDKSLDQLRSAARSSGWCATSCRLEENELRQLSASSRPSQIASLVVNGLAQIHR